MITKDLGAVTAYAEAVEAGYTGTEEEYAALLASYATVAQNAAASASAAATSATAAAGSATSAAASASEASTTVSGAITNIEAAGTAQVGLVTAEGTTQIGLVSAEGAAQVSAVDAKGVEVIESIPEDYTELSADVTQLKSDLSDINDVLDMSSVTVTASGSGNNYVTYAIETGKKYTFKVESSANCSIATVDASNQTIENVGTLMNGNSLVFTATQDAPKVLFYFRASGTGYITPENAIDAIEGQIAELNDDLIKAVGHISASVTASGSGNNYVTYAIKAGETYNFTVSSTATCSIATVSATNQTIENVGGLMNGSLQFTATQDAPKVLFYFRASGTGSVTTVNELDGIIELANTKYAKQWTGKTWSNYGDSISWLFDWHSYVNILLGFSEFIRNGKPGAPISWSNTTFGIDANGIYTTGTPVKTVHESMCAYDRISETLDNTLPLIFVMGGTNDFLGNVPLGDLTFNSADTTDSAWRTANAVGDYNINTFKGAMASMLMKLQYYAPNALIVFGTLLNGIGATSGANQYAEQVNTANLKPFDYAKAEKEVCSIFGIPCIDVFAECGINIANRSTYISDTVHPNSAGMKLLGRCVASGLSKMFPRSV